MGEFTFALGGSLGLGEAFESGIGMLVGWAGLVFVKGCLLLALLYSEDVMLWGS